MSDPITFSEDEVRPQRVCHVCGQTDDHPRLQYEDGVPLPDGSPRVLLFHYDCTPAYVEADHPSPAYAAAKRGDRGDKLVAVVRKHQLSLAKAYDADLSTEGV